MGHVRILKLSMALVRWRWTIGCSARTMLGLQSAARRLSVCGSHTMDSKFLNLVPGNQALWIPRTLRVWYLLPSAKKKVVHWLGSRALMMAIQVQRVSERRYQLRQLTCAVRARRCQDDMPRPVHSKVSRTL